MTSSAGGPVRSEPFPAVARGLRRASGIIVALVLVAYLGATAYEILSGYRGALHRAEMQAATIARALEEHVARTIGEADRALINVSDSLRNDAAETIRLVLGEVLVTGGAALGDVAALLRAARERTPDARDLDHEAALIALEDALHALSARVPHLIITDTDESRVAILDCSERLRSGAARLAGQARQIETAQWERFITLLNRLSTIETRLRDLASTRAQPIDTIQAGSSNEAVIHRLLKRATEDLPQMRSLVLMTTDGTWVADSTSFPHRPFSSADRAYFLQHRNAPETELLIGRVVQSKGPDRRSFFTLSRGLVDADGAFVGVLAGAVEADYFASFYQSIGLPPRSTVQIVGHDGFVLVREPQDEDAAGTSLVTTPLFRAIRTDGTSGVLHTIDHLTREREIVGYREVPNLPLTVTVALDRSVVLEGWRRDATRTFVLALLVTLAVIGLALQLSALIQRQARSAAALAERERDYRSIFDNAREGIFRTTAEGLILRANDAFLKLFGYSSLAEALSITDISRQVWVNGGHRKLMLDEIHRAGEVHDFVFDARRQDDGTIIKVAMSARLVRDAWGRDSYIEGYCLDVTDRLREAEELRQAHWAAEDANRAKSQFLANMSHELRTPLNAILGFSEVIRDKMFGDQAIDRYAQYGGDIHTAGLHLLALIDDVLDLSKIEADRYELTRELVDIADPIAECMTMMEPRARKNVIDLRAEVAPNLPAIHGDRRVVRQVLLNLVSNAVKFTGTGGAVLIGARQEDDWIVVRVADTGIGVAPADLPHLFQPFRRADSAVKSEVEGTGLGLAISRRFVEMHGGTIELASMLGSGTTVTARFPLPARQTAVAVA